MKQKKKSYKPLHEVYSCNDEKGDIPYIDKINGLIKGVQVTGVLGFHRKGQLSKKYCVKTGSYTQKYLKNCLIAMGQSQQSGKNML